MLSILPDGNVQGQFRQITQVIRTTVRQKIWDSLKVEVVTLESLGLSPEATDREVWTLCQRRDTVLITGNRNNDGPESMDFTLRTLTNSASLPILTIANPNRIFQVEYAKATADRMLDHLIRIEELRGTRRLII